MLKLPLGICCDCENESNTVNPGWILYLVFAVPGVCCTLGIL